LQFRLRSPLECGVKQGVWWHGSWAWLGVLSLIGMLALLGLVVAAMSPDARGRLADVVFDAMSYLKKEATRSRPEREQFAAALRARTRWALATPTLIVLMAAIFVLMRFGAHRGSDLATLTAWGANFWLRTRNGEWWRLVSSIFVHAGIFSLLVNIAALAQIGTILERLVGRLIVIAVFLTAGTFASLVNLMTRPASTGLGASGAILGLYGLLLASSIWSLRHRSEVTMSLTIAKTLIPAGCVFILYNSASGSLGIAAELTGLLVGLVWGAVLSKGVADHIPSPRRLAHLTATAAVIVVLSAISLRGVTDVKPEIQRTIAVEDRTSEAYEAAAEQFKADKITAEALARVIDRTISPELEDADARLKALTAVPREDQPLVANAEEYVRLRLESWRLRSEWLRKTAKAPRQGTEAAEYRINRGTFASAEEK
jgi:rhomboid protease GluP